MSETSRRHRAEAPKRLRFALITVSTSKAREAEAGGKPLDESGNLAEALLKEAGHSIVFRRIVADDALSLISLIKELLALPDLDVIVAMGGTGVSRSDVTIEAVEGLLEKRLPGFGELLRLLSFKHIGPSAFLTRALAGTARGKVVFCLPGSPNAVETAFRELIIPEAGHVVKHAREP